MPLVVNNLHAHAHTHTYANTHTDVTDKYDYKKLGMQKAGTHVVYYNTCSARILQQINNLRK